MNTAIWWIRRDLRLSDNQALAAAMHEASVVIPLFILDPWLLASPNVGQGRLAFLLEGLRALEASLRGRGSGLILREGDPLEVLHILCLETGAEGIFAEADISPYALRRDERVRHDLPLYLVSGITVHPPQILLKADGSPYTVFTPFSRMWRSLPFPGNPLAAPERLPALPQLTSLELPATPRHPADSLFPASEAEGQKRLARFADFKIGRYDVDRNRMDLDGTSGLSPYLRFGMVSARQAARAAHQAEAWAMNAAEHQG
ncbi:MAG TPA: deoxyribodipyrimidine photo-lyase, partial [Anaerolineales bacterium]